MNGLPLKRVSSNDLLPQPFDWAQVSAGSVTIGTYNTGGYVSQHATFEIPAFEIARYPVTNTQYAKSVEANGYKNRAWWTEEGWQEHEKHHWTEPRYWRDAQWNQGNHPVVGVSWFEASAFCLWLSAATDEQISLPNEQQWQRAGQGDSNWKYPWGNTFESDRCNFNTSGTAAVTMFAGKNKGDSVFGVTDLAGNVWEWCQTGFVTGSNEFEARDVRVMRGGCWDNTEESSVQLDFRDWMPPYHDSCTRGFRIVRDRNPV